MARVRGSGMASSIGRGLLAASFASPVVDPVGRASHRWLPRAPTALLLLGLTLWALLAPGCTRGCVRDVSLAVKAEAERYLEPVATRRAALVGAKTSPYAPALVKLRGLVGSGKPVDWRLMSTAERQLALSGLLGVELDHDDQVMLDLLLVDQRVDPFAPDPLGVPPFAVAMLEDARVARRIVAMLDEFPRTRPPDAVLCGLRGRGLPGVLAGLRAYCACVQED